ncbi:MAG: hypothetical protein A3K19_20250 [Lentisphaerae bacterium RIFOXYB12_FULL_65_16]|nr:MAG: hypothetical protein A3K18_25395 [Lentisphaerae bacterium RIFOXYA12_64_32]OGV89539.1 MAG: hypothetical protein A3K19_20250 [Lentisphaerae bacterium RIFOXYB12_FULL_65_16]
MKCRQLLWGTPARQAVSRRARRASGANLPAWLVVATGLTLFAWPGSAQQPAANIRVDGDRYLLGNGTLERTVDLSGGAVRTTSIRNQLTGKDIALASDEFVLKLNDTQELRTADFTVTGKELKDLPNGARQLVVNLASPKAGIEVQLRYDVAAHAPVLRKVVAVRAAGEGKPLLNSIEVEHFTTDTTCDLGGLGQPVFVDGSVFLGLEYPAGHNDVADNAKATPSRPGFTVTLRHLPGKVLTSDFLESKAAVLGAGPSGAVERTFATYLGGIRVPPRTHVHYNSWYDIRQNQMSTAAFLETFSGFKTNLCDKYDVRMDSFVPDDGWQDHNSIWEVDKNLFPNGLGELAAGLKAGGTTLGLWHPLTAVVGNLDMKWCQGQGYETDKAGSHLCLSAPKHNAQLREVMARHVKEYGLTYFKHDFNSFACDGEGHGHLPRNEYGFEANVDAYIEMLKLFRQISPDIFLNITGGMWLSPWWLMYCNTVWRGASDTGYEIAHPFVNQRAQAISYVDGVLYDNFVKNRYQFPVSALMVHGIVYGQLHLLGGKDEPLESWADNAVWSVCLGLMMKELYITPRLLSDAHWDTLGKSLQWAEANKDVLVETRMILGNPHAGEPVGYQHAVGDRTIVFVRNPSLTSQKVRVGLAPPEGNATRRVVEIVYPYHQILARDADPMQPLDLELAANEMLAIEAMPLATWQRPLLEGCRYALASQTATEFVFELAGEKAEPTTVNIKAPKPIAEILLDGAPVPVQPGTTATVTVPLQAASQTLQIEDLSGTEAPLKNTVKVTLPATAKDGRFFLVCEGTQRPLPLGPITVNGKPVKTSSLAGDRWKTIVVPLSEPTNTISWEVLVAARPKTPFGATAFAMSSYATAKRPLATKRLTVRLAESAGMPGAALPAPFAAQTTTWLRSNRGVMSPPPHRAVSPGCRLPT